MQWFLNLSTRLKIVCCFSLMFVLIIIVIGTAYLGITAITQSQHELFHDNFMASLCTVEVRSAQNRARAQLLEMMMTSDRTKLQELERDIRERAEDIDQKLKELADGHKNDQGFKADLQELVSVRNAYHKTREEQIGQILEGKVEAASQIGLGQQEERYNKIRDITIKLEQQEVEQAKQLLAQSEQRARKSLFIFFLVGAVAIFISTAMTLIMNKAIAKPLMEISGTAERIAAGELDFNLSSSTRGDEVGLLIQMFRRMAENIKGYAMMTRKIAAGDLSGTVTPQSEKDVMGNALAAMVVSLRKLTSEIVAGVNVLAASSSEIMASTNQVATGATETAAAVSETTSTVEEVKQTSQVASTKARDVAEVAQKAVQVAQAGRRAVEESIAGMGRIQGQVAVIADSIVRLSEQSQTIGEIIATVNDLAEQSNLLAVNAAIEAAKAGEQGKGFGVVAQEVKSLAEQSKEATSQVRAILNDIQKATNSSIMMTEEGTHTVTEVTQLVQKVAELLGETPA